MASPDLTRTQMSPREDIVGALQPHQLSAIVEELAQGGASLRAMPRAARVDAIVRAITSLKQENAHIFQRLITESAGQLGWSEAMARFVLQDLLKLMSAPGLMTLLHDELDHESHEQTFVANTWRATQRMLVAPEVVVHILSSTVPTTAIEALVFSLAAGVPCLLRSSQHELAAGRFFLRVLREAAPELAEHAAVVTWPSDDERFVAAITPHRPQIVFHGSDRSLHRFRKSLNEELPVQAFGHRISFAVIAPPAPLSSHAIDALADGLALDATLFEGQGCMSPQTVFVLPHPAQKDLAKRLATQLTERAFPALAERFPRGPVPPKIAAAQMQQIGVASFTGRALQGAAGNALLWDQVELRDAPGWRHLHLCTLSNLEALVDALEPYRHQLSTAGIHIHPRSLQSASQLLARMGVRRVCPIGHMQRPVLLRSHDGQRRVRPWFQSCDLEG